MVNGKGRKIQHFVPVPGTELQYPETVIFGTAPGKCVTVSAGVHSREYVGIEAVNRLAEELTPAMIAGELHLIHALNFNGLIRRSADVFPEDGENLNRVFPGDADGSDTHRLAAFLEREVIRNSDVILDLHSGGFCEALVPHVYFHGAAAAEVNQQSEMLARHFNVPYIVRSAAKNGFYSYAGQCGVPAVILERGGAGLWSEEEAEADREDIRNVLRYLGTLRDGISAVKHDPKLLPGGFYEDAPASGLWYPLRHPGDPVQKGEELGQIRDIFGTVLHTCRSKADGVLLYQTVSLGIEQDHPMIAYGADH